MRGRRDADDNRPKCLVMRAARPFLRWPGGKRWLLPHISRVVTDISYERYIEPFLGGGAIFFGLRPEAAVLSDINPDLINTYRQVRDNADALVRALQDLRVDAQTYAAIRSTNPVDPQAAAVRFLYLNRTAFSGMYRLNQRGQFNVPFGGGERTPDVLWKSNLLEEASCVLRHAVFMIGDFECVLAAAQAGDLVYCDPTYTTRHNNNGFVRYNERNFSWADQVRLARACLEASQRGATVIVSNAVHYEILRLYQGAEAHIVERWSGLCPTPEKRGQTQEYLFILQRVCAGTIPIAVLGDQA